MEKDERMKIGRAAAFGESEDEFREAYEAEEEDEEGLERIVRDTLDSIGDCSDEHLFEKCGIDEWRAFDDALARLADMNVLYFDTDQCDGHRIIRSVPALI